MKHWTFVGVLAIMILSVPSAYAREPTPAEKCATALATGGSYEDEFFRCEGRQVQLNKLTEDAFACANVYLFGGHHSGLLLCDSEGILEGGDSEPGEDSLLWEVRKCAAAILAGEEYNGPHLQCNGVS